MYIGIPVGSDGHVTITFNGHGEAKIDYLGSVAALAETTRWWYANGLGRVALAFGPTSRLGACWVAPVTSKRLGLFRERLVQELDRRGVYYSEQYEFNPHVTLSYEKAAGENPYEGTTHIATSYVVVSKAFGTSEVRV